MTNQPEIELYGGMMSGSSLDAADAALVEFSAQGNRPRILAQHSLPLPPALRGELLALNQPGGLDELERAARASGALMACYAESFQHCLEQAHCSAREVTALGAHGQTVRHRPELGYTLQLQNGALLAQLTGVAVVTDFRSGDVAAGGQGAPLVPGFHAAMWGDAAQTRVILNLGGIANLTLLVPGQVPRGYDTGPGNLLMDAWTQRHCQRPYDDKGAWGGRGTPRPEVLEALLAHPYFATPPPKSTGRDDFHLAWLEQVLAQVAPAPQGHALFSWATDIQATLQRLTVQSIAASLKRENLGQDWELLVCGGGAANLALLERLRQVLPQAHLSGTDHRGLAAPWVEACAFAWLARQRILAIPANLPSVTGARRPVILGALYLP